MTVIFKLLSMLAGALLALIPLVTAAQGTASFPTRPLRIVVPTPPGGASDTAARLLSQSLSASLGQQVIVENKPGASGAIAVQAVMAAPADGYTLLWGLSSMAGLPILQKNPPFQQMSELTPVSNVLNFGYGLFVSNNVPARNIAELAAYGKANPGKLSYATGTLGEYMFCAYVFKALGVDAVRVPYKGGVQLMPDLINGLVHVNIGPIAVGMQHARAGKLKMIATALPQRSAAMPDVPTLAEAGVTGLNLPTWNGVFAPPGTPRDVVTKLSTAIVQALANPTLRNTLEQQGSQVIGSTPQQLAETVEASAQSWRNFVRDYDVPQE